MMEGCGCDNSPRQACPVSLLLILVGLVMVEFAVMPLL
jgi:hypothetical protein